MISNIGMKKLVEKVRLQEVLLDQVQHLPSLPHHRKNCHLFSDEFLQLVALKLSDEKTCVHSGFFFYRGCLCHIYLTRGDRGTTLCEVEILFEEVDL